MSKSLTLEDLNGLSEADLKDTILKYADALNTANSNVQVMVTNVQNKDAEILKLNEAVKVLHEANNKLTLALSEAQAQVEQQDTGITFNEEEYNSIVEKYNSVVKTLEEKNNIIKGQEETIGLFKKEKNKNIDKVLEASVKEIETLKKENISLKKENETLVEKIKLFNSDKGFVAKKELDFILQTYNIKGWDNRTGTASSGGREFNKVVILAKLVDNTLIWNIESKALDYTSRHQIVLDDESKAELDLLITKLGSFGAIKEFLNIPNSMENAFPNGKYLKHRIE